MFFTTIFINKGLPASFLVTNSKQGDIYARYLKTLIKNTGGKWAPEIMMSDFEGGIHFGILQAFNGWTLSRKCWFHLSQAVFKYTHKAGNLIMSHFKLANLPQHTMY